MGYKDVDEYLDDQEDWAKDILIDLRKIVMEACPDAKEDVKWAQPVYSVNGPMIFIKAHKSHVNFGFWRGVQLDDPENILEGSGRKMRHLKLRKEEEIKEGPLKELVKQAVELNLEHGSAAMKKGI